MKYPYLFLFIACLLCKASDAQTVYPGGVTGCIARWDFTSTGSFSALPDVSGNSNPGATFNMNGSMGFRGHTNTAGNFNSTTTYATVTNKSMLSPSAITIVSVVKPTSFNSNGCQYNTVLIKGTDYNLPGCYGTTIYDNDGNCAILGSNQTADFIGSVASAPFLGPNLVANNWYLLITCYNGSFIKRYNVPLDPNFYNTSIGPSSVSPVSAALGSNSADIRIGQNQNSALNYISPFTGDMDEVALFNKVLSDAEIQSVYNYVWGGVSINQPFTDTFLCPNAPFTLSYTVHDASTFSGGNVFTAQLSDATGSFLSFTNIGTVNSSASGTITCTMPPGLSMGGAYRVRITASGPNYTSPDNGKDIVIGHATTTAAITANPGLTVANNVSVVFTADVPNKGTSVTYTWKKNDVPISGANGPTYTGMSGVDFKDKDSISVSVKVNDVNCVYTDSVTSNKLGMSVGVGIKNITNVSNLKVYPNPNTGSFNITGNAVNNQPLQVEILNTIGQVVYHDNLTPVNSKLDNNIKLDNAPSGVYLLRATSGNGISTARFTISK